MAQGRAGPNLRSIAVITGLPQEADAFCPGAGTLSRLGRLDVRQVTVGDAIVHLACGGIGKVAAATTAALVARMVDADLLMVIGTAGALDSDVGGAPYWLARAIQHDYGAARPDRFAHYDAGSWPMGPDGAAGFAALAQPAGLGLGEAMIASGDCFIECAVRAGTIRDVLGASLVDMETAAVAQAAAILGLPWCAIKAATDEANGDSAGDFAANLAATARRAALAAELAIARMADRPWH